MSKEQKASNQISSKEVEHIASLARIKLTDQEKKRFTKELSSILNYVQKLNEVDTKQAKAIEQITGLENITRDDQTQKKSKELRKRILNQAPKTKGDYFKTPKILE